MDGADHTEGQRIDETLRRAKRAAKNAAARGARAARNCHTPGEYVDAVYRGARKVKDKTRVAYEETFRAEPARDGWVEHDTLAPPPLRSYASWIHAAGAIAWIATILSAGVTFFAPLLVVLVMWQSRKHDSDFIDDHGREAMNFQISLFPLTLIGTLLTCGLGLVLLPAFAIAFGFVAFRAAGRAEYYRYPMTFRFLRGSRAA